MDLPPIVISTLQLLVRFAVPAATPLTAEGLSPLVLMMFLTCKNHGFTVVAVHVIVAVSTVPAGFTLQSLAAAVPNDTLTNRNCVCV
jgi:hypothetical protein